MPSKKTSYTPDTVFSESSLIQEPKKEIKSLRISFAIAPNDYQKFRVVAAQMSNQTGKRCTPNSIFTEWLTGFLEEHSEDLIGFKEVPHDSHGKPIK